MTVKVLADSINAATGDRLTTVEAVYPRVVHSEFMTHRMFSRNAASSRAKPISRVIQDVIDNPYIPRAFGLKQRGMQPAEFTTPEDDEYYELRDWWLNARDRAVQQAKVGMNRGLHKQVVNRLLEPFQYITTIVSATEWDNFIKLRTEVDENGNPMADIPIYDLALEVKEALGSSTPVSRGVGDWHLPYVGEDVVSHADRLDISAARCARVSYKTYDGKTDIGADLRLAKSLRDNNHWSPFEHVAVPVTESKFNRNFVGWKQYRQILEENSF